MTVRRDASKGKRHTRVLISHGHDDLPTRRHKLRRRFVAAVVILGLLALLVEFGELVHLRR